MSSFTTAAYERFVKFNGLTRFLMIYNMSVDFFFFLKCRLQCLCQVLKISNERIPKDASRWTPNGKRKKKAIKRIKTSTQKCSGDRMMKNWSLMEQNTGWYTVSVEKCNCNHMCPREGKNYNNILCINFTISHSFCWTVTFNVPKKKCSKNVIQILKLMNSSV